MFLLYSARLSSQFSANELQYSQKHEEKLKHLKNFKLVDTRTKHEKLPVSSSSQKQCYGNQHPLYHNEF